MGQGHSRSRQAGTSDEAESSGMPSTALAGLRYDSRWTPSPPIPAQPKRTDPSQLRAIEVPGQKSATEAAKPKRVARRRERKAAEDGKRTSSATRSLRTVRRSTSSLVISATPTCELAPALPPKEAILNPYSPIPSSTARMPSMGDVVSPVPRAHGGISFVVSETPSPRPVPFPRRASDAAQAVELPFTRATQSLGKSVPRHSTPSVLAVPLLDNQSRASSPSLSIDDHADPLDILYSSIRALSYHSARTPSPEVASTSSSSLEHLPAALRVRRSPSPAPQIPVHRSPSPFCLDDELREVQRLAESIARPSPRPTSSSSRRPLPMSPGQTSHNPFAAPMDAFASFKTWSQTTQIAAAPSPSVFASTTTASPVRHGLETDRAVGSTSRARTFDSAHPSSAEASHLTASARAMSGSTAPPSYKAERSDNGKRIHTAKSAPF